MAEILIKATSYTHPDPEQDKGVYKVGMPVVVMPDGHPWGNAERLPHFFRINFPGVPVEKVLKYLEQSSGRRRVWQFTLDSLPEATRAKLFSQGMITIKADTAYNGVYDFTWKQVRNYLKNLDTGLTESGEL